MCLTNVDQKRFVILSGVSYSAPKILIVTNCVAIRAK